MSPRTGGGGWELLLDFIWFALRNGTWMLVGYAICYYR
jgi:hypothetical protein